MNTRLWTTLGLCTLLTLTIACQGETTTKDLKPSDDKNTASPDKKLFDKQWTEDGMKGHARVEEIGKGQLAPTTLVDTRLRRRLDIDQLDAALKRVTGGIGWTERRGNRDVNLFNDLAESLGKPDYIDSTQEDLEVSLIFQKFLGDAARSSCTKLIDREKNTRPETKHLLIHVSLEDTPETAQEKINQNLSALLLNFHGRYHEPDSPKLERWRWLFKSSHHVAKDTAAAWRTVCVGLITHPDFYTY